MKIFLSASIRGGRDLLPTYMKMHEFLQNEGHEVLSWHVADPELEKTESVMSEQEIYQRDMDFLRNAKCVIAELSTASTGVGYEICSALQLGLPVLCLYLPDANVSAMILGNDSKLLKCRMHGNFGELEKEITTFLDEMK
ncbi:nucleoside 2-deoxyribosyltransferase [Methanolobus sp. ZRKC3]|uniref:nucleoside 2-deoxyribosyltransferase n=1 Tax=Methanolobus sp. ZRKC3 TaxID=3125786 RepID=UPI003245466D